jgi:Tol biopolymer transport system component
MAAGAFLTVVAGVVIGCGGGGDGGPGLTSATNATASASTATASASTATATATTATATATTATATTATATATTAQGQLPANVVFYGEATGEGNQLRYISPDGTGDQLYAALTTNVRTVGLDPVHQNVKVFSYRSTEDGNDALLRNTTLDNASATQLVGPTYSYIDQIQVSPDGKTIYFIAGVGDADSQLLSVPYEGGNVTVIDNAWTFHVNQAGTQIVYSKLVSGNEEIFVRNVGTTGAGTRLTTNTSEDTMPQWSKNGSKIVFASNRRNVDDFDLFTMNANGTSQTALTQSDDTIELGGSFNEAGDKVAYAGLGGEATTGGLYTVPAVGGNRTAIKPSDALTGSAYWTTAGGRSRTSGYGLSRRIRHGAAGK